MVNLPLAATVMAAALLVAQHAAAQDAPPISLRLADPRTWDLAAHVGWAGSHKPDIGEDWDDWSAAFAGGVSVGRYLAPHIKTEIRAVVTREGRIYTQAISPADPFPIFRSRAHYFRATSIDAGVSYQFFENQWFHPFAGGGLEVVRERHRIEVPQQFVPPRGPGGVPVPVPAVPVSPEVTYSARPFVATGLKWYVAEHAFVRTTLQLSIGRSGLTHTWMAGFGADL